jgi:hypothetical protein
LISGTVEIPEELKNHYLELVCRYEGEPSNANSKSTGAMSGTFSIDGLRAGNVFLDLRIGHAYGLDLGTNERNRFYVKSITFRGLDLRAKPLKVTEGQTYSGVHIVIAEGAAEGSVSVRDAEGKPVAGRRLALAPVDEARWLFTHALTPGVSDARGNFSFKCAPGEYFVILSDGNDYWPPTVETIRKHAANAPRFQLKLGSNSPFTVTVP